jgi:small conductance mechanosensitive channel
MQTRRIDLVVRVGYEDDLRRGRTTLLDVMRSDARVLEEPQPRVNVR